MLKKLWMDEGGATISAELALIGTILVVGVVVGLSAVQDAVVTELADLGAAISNLDQSYSSGGVTGHHASSAASAFSDGVDFCDSDACTQAGSGSRCVTICVGKTSGGADGGT
jgi:Flp pilus assembly pilin Flp